MTTNNTFFNTVNQFWKRKYCILRSFYRDGKFLTPFGKENVA